MPDAEALLRSLFEAGVAAAAPAHCMQTWMPRRPDGDVVVVGAGKAAAAMAFELERRWDAPLSGCVVVPPGYESDCKQIEVLTAAHPIPDESCIAAAERILAEVSDLSASDTVVCLLSGGGSALLTAPLPGISLADKRRISEALLASGAAIHEINTVRKKLSAIKGGKLAAAALPAPVISLVISDVQGNDLSLVASGPTVADGATVNDALAILRRYDIAADKRVVDAMRVGHANPIRLPEADVRMLASSDDALQAAAFEAMQADVTPYLLGDLGGDARDLAAEHAALARRIAAGDGPVAPPCVVISGGETTVRLQGKGRGGRNGEYALALVMALDGQPGIFALAADTDGIDGCGDNAGCFVSPDTLQRASTAGVSGVDCQRENDSYAFFGAAGQLLITGPTKTNVNDFRAILIVSD